MTNTDYEIALVEHQISAGHRALEALHEQKRHQLSLLRRTREGFLRQSAECEVKKRQYKMKVRMATKIQSWIRGEMSRRWIARLFYQRSAEVRDAAREEAKEKMERNLQALRRQVHALYYSDRRIRKKAAIILQRFARGMLARLFFEKVRPFLYEQRKQRIRLAEETYAGLIIQSAWRGRSGRLIAAELRAVKASEERAIMLERLRYMKAISLIKRVFQGMLARRAARQIRNMNQTDRRIALTYRQNIVDNSGNLISGEKLANILTEVQDRLREGHSHLKTPKARKGGGVKIKGVSPRGHGHQQAHHHQRIHRSGQNQDVKFDEKFTTAPDRPTPSRANKSMKAINSDSPRARKTAGVTTALSYTGGGIIGDMINVKGTGNTSSASSLGGSSTKVSKPERVSPTSTGPKKSVHHSAGASLGGGGNHSSTGSSRKTTMNPNFKEGRKTTSAASVSGSGKDGNGHSSATSSLKETRKTTSSAVASNTGSLKARATVMAAQSVGKPASEKHKSNNSSSHGSGLASASGGGPKKSVRHTKSVKIDRKTKVNFDGDGDSPSPPAGSSRKTQKLLSKRLSATATDANTKNNLVISPGVSRSGSKTTSGQTQSQGGGTSTGPSSKEGPSKTLLFKETPVNSVSVAGGGDNSVSVNLSLKSQKSSDSGPIVTEGPLSKLLPSLTSNSAANSKSKPIDPVTPIAQKVVPNSALTTATKPGFGPGPAAGGSTAGGSFVPRPPPGAPPNNSGSINVPSRKSVPASAALLGPGANMASTLGAPVTVDKTLSRKSVGGPRASIRPGDHNSSSSKASNAGNANQQATQAGLSGIFETSTHQAFEMNEMARNLAAAAGDDMDPGGVDGILNVAFMEHPLLDGGDLGLNQNTGPGSKSNPSSRQAGAARKLFQFDC